MAYIEREQVCEICNNKGVDCGKEKCPVYKVPTADVVEVVRCKDCEHYKPQPKYKNGETKYCCRSAYVRVNADDYCSYGKRKEDE